MFFALSQRRPRITLSRWPREDYDKPNNHDILLFASQTEESKSCFPRRWQRSRHRKYTTAHKLSLQDQEDKDYPYTQVHVTLLDWMETDLDIAETLTNLTCLFCEECQFTPVERFALLSRKPYSLLSTRIYKWTTTYSNQESLLIVYYNGHGDVDSMRHLKWNTYREWAFPRPPSVPVLTISSSEEKTKSPILYWNSLQIHLDRTEPDLLTILDCCCAAGSSNSVFDDFEEGGRNEILAAGGYNDVTQNDFSQAFFKKFSQKVSTGSIFSVSQFHQSLLLRMQCESKPNTGTWFNHTSVYLLEQGLPMTEYSFEGPGGSQSYSSWGGLGRSEWRLSLGRRTAVRYRRNRAMPAMNIRTVIQSCWLPQRKFPPSLNPAYLHFGKVGSWLQMSDDS